MCATRGEIVERSVDGIRAVVGDEHKLFVRATGIHSVQTDRWRHSRNFQLLL